MRLAMGLSDKTERSRLIARFASGLRFPYLFLLIAALFVADLIIPDAIPFVDEVSPRAHRRSPGHMERAQIRRLQAPDEEHHARTMSGRKRSTYRLVALSILTALYACANAEVDERRYEVKGQVVSVDADNGMVTLDHEDIGDFMTAMTMPFPLKDTWAFEYLEPGDGVNAILVVRGQEHWLEQIVISEPPAPLDADTVPPPRLGEPVPDIELVNQDGTNIHISDYRGKALLVTFIYTRCPLAEFCPRMTSQFGALEKMLRDEPELYEKTHLLTISFDSRLRHARDAERIRPQPSSHNGGRVRPLGVRNGNPGEHPGAGVFPSARLQR